MIGKLKSKEEIAKDTLKVVFEVDEPFSFEAGQYCFITLPQLKYPDEKGPKRHFSIVNSPNEKGIISFTTRRMNSGFKKTLEELPIGSEVELGPIAGVFTLPADSQRPLTFIAGGIGITPFISMLRCIKEENLPYKITLIYSNRDKDSTAYLDEVQNYQLPTTNYKLVLTMTDDPIWMGEKRKVDAQFIKEYFSLGDEPTSGVNDQSYMVVGPPGMVDAVRQSLTEAGVSQENIKFENFTGY